jgi:hypothetical protein
MKAVVAGIGLRFSRSFRGNNVVVGSRIEWQWCLAVYYRTPWTRDGGWANWYARRYFYFGRTHTEDAPGYLEYAHSSTLSVLDGWRFSYED